VNAEELRAEMERRGIQWEVREDPVEAQPRLGYVPSQGSPSLEEQEQIAKELAEVAAQDTSLPSYPEIYDLRDVDGRNFITAVKDQGACGSCVAFGSVSTVEGSLRVQEQDPDLEVDLSEAHLFYCAAAGDDCRCADGWYPKRALAVFKSEGVPPESTFPYTAGDQACASADGWQDDAVKISDWVKLETPAEIKAWISTRGPAMASMTVYEDFQHYAGGIYRQVTGDNLGGHCICAVGYDEEEGYWIIKNSWNTGWGEDGFVRIAYGEVGIDSAMLGVDGVLAPAGAASD
jgi:C1A family cysteine protease